VAIVFEDHFHGTQFGSEHAGTSGCSGEYDSGTAASNLLSQFGLVAYLVAVVHVREGFRSIVNLSSVAWGFVAGGFGGGVCFVVGGAVK
jgi:NAD(P)-dependent dehydrogenase (short-subunit alcohol dehydrogenase family)